MTNEKINKRVSAINNLIEELIVDVEDEIDLLEPLGEETEERRNKLYRLLNQLYDTDIDYVDND